jgi:FtsH-binding integral membrane protein
MSMNTAFDRMQQTWHRGFDLNALLKSNDIESHVQNHLCKVYLMLACGVGVAAGGAWVHLLYNIGGLLTLLATFGTMMILAMDSDKTLNTSRLATFAAFTFFQGASLGSLVEVALMVDPSIIVTAFSATVAVFLCFSGAAMFARRRSYLYLGGLLSSALSVMCIVGLLNMFVQSSALMVLRLYVGLAVFVGFVVYDTQMIVEKASNGSTDVVWHAVELFVDFVGIFVRLVIILLRNANNKKRDNNRR